jgi:hypothetical protein
MGCLAFLFLNGLSCIGIFFLTYIATGFCLWQYNIGEWSENVRINFFVLNLVFDFAMFCVFATGADYKNWEDSQREES